MGSLYFSYKPIGDPLDGKLSQSTAMDKEALAQGWQTVRGMEAELEQVKPIAQC